MKTNTSKKNKFYYLVVAVEKNSGDEYTEFTSTNQKEALKLARYAFNRMSLADQNKQIIEVRQYKQNLYKKETIYSDYDTIIEFTAK